MFIFLTKPESLALLTAKFCGNFPFLVMESLRTALLLTAGVQLWDNWVYYFTMCTIVGQLGLLFHHVYNMSGTFPLFWNTV